jgi:tRNA G18 (ribose-2'-O)-methylase SpoU
VDRVLSKSELRESKPGRGDFAGQARSPITVVLDRVTGLYNIGALFRLCDAFLVERLIICGEASGPALLRKRKLVQAAMGTHRWVPWQQEPDAAVPVTAMLVLSATNRAASRRPCWPMPIRWSRFRCWAWRTRSTWRQLRRS